MQRVGENGNPIGRLCDSQQLHRTVAAVQADHADVLPGVLEAGKGIRNR
jgi:hypothetical protein